MNIFTSLFNWVKDNMLIALAAIVGAWFFLFRKKGRRRVRRGFGRARSYGRRAYSAVRNRGRGRRRY